MHLLKKKKKKNGLYLIIYNILHVRDRKNKTNKLICKNMQKYLVECRILYNFAADF